MPFRPEVARMNELRVVFEDDHLVVVDKPAGRDSTTGIGDWLVVHRLDRATSGLLVYAKRASIARRLNRQFAARAVTREYRCVVNGRMAGGTIESFLARDRGDGLRGSAPGGDGKVAITHVEVLEALADRTVCRVTLGTGRTHQIRIHLAEAGHPVVGERVYVRDARQQGITLIDSERLLLHATVLGFTHPATKERLLFESPAPW